MSKDINICLSSDRITARAGETVRIRATFDREAFASVNERREQAGYQNVMRTADKVAGIDIEAVVHGDTTDFVIMADTTGEAHLAERQNAVEVWYHVIIDNGGTTPGDLGQLRYKVGLVSDLHIDTEDSHNSEYGNDMINAIDYFRKNGAAFMCNAGDICQYNDKDMELYNQLYTNYAWAPSGAQFRIFTALGNHDHLRLFSNGQDLGHLCNQFTVFTGEDYWKQYGYQKKTDYIQFFEYDGKWNEQQYGRGRTTKSKLSYWVELNGDIYVFLSIDYGAHANPNVWDWCARGMNLLNHNDPYVKQMEAYVADTPYDRSRERLFDYQFYHPNALTWLKDILEHNQDKRVFVFAHHFMPNKAGDIFGDYSRLRIWPYSQSPAVQQKYYAGSNTICGITFWYMNKLMQQYRNVLWISGHSHYMWGAQVDFVDDDYAVRQPSGKETVPLTDNLQSLIDTDYDYRLYTPVGNPIGKCAPTLHLPSLAKPVGGTGKTAYGGSEGAMMEVYDRAVIIRCIRFKADGSKAYKNEEVKQIII